MDKFKTAVKYILKWEGSEYVNNPNDSGGATKYGISSRWYKSYLANQGKIDITEDYVLHFIQNLTEDTASQLYYDEFWNRYYEDINNQEIVNYIFDMAIHHGPNMAHKITQRSFWAFTGNQILLKDDGVFGPKTLTYLNQYDILILPVMRSERAGYCRLITEVNTKNKEFLNGWLRRVYR